MAALLDYEREDGEELLENVRVYWISRLPELFPDHLLQTAQSMDIGDYLGELCNRVVCRALDHPGKSAEARCLMHGISLVFPNSLENTEAA
ncbi:MAG: hypothetical protein NVS4B2_34830 [Chloroflexota bacterium]